MKRLALLALAVTLLVGCGGGRDWTSQLSQPSDMTRVLSVYYYTTEDTETRGEWSRSVEEYHGEIAFDHYFIPTGLANVLGLGGEYECNSRDESKVEECVADWLRKNADRVK